MRRRYDAQQWRDWIDEQRQSGLTVTEFCLRKQVSEGVFYSWRRKLAAEPSADLFVPVAIARAAMVEIELPGEVTIRVPNDAVSLQPVLRVLLGRCGPVLGLARGLRVFLCTEPADMRRSFDGLAGMTATIIEQDPLAGHLFVFRNRNRDRVKILYWDRDGLAIWYKRLEKGTFQFPTDLVDREHRQVRAEISVDELSLLLGGIDLRSVERRKRFRRPGKPR